MQPRAVFPSAYFKLPTYAVIQLNQFNEKWSSLTIVTLVNIAYFSGWLRQMLFLFQALKDLDYEVREKMFTEALLGIEFTDGSEKGVLYSGNMAKLSTKKKMCLFC